MHRDFWHSDWHMPMLGREHRAPADRPTSLNIAEIRDVANVNVRGFIARRKTFDEPDKTNLSVVRVRERLNEERRRNVAAWIVKIPLTIDNSIGAGRDQIVSAAEGVCQPLQKCRWAMDADDVSAILLLQKLRRGIRK
jgi:hypothetical protein